MHEIRLELSDWMYNAGIVGLMNILRDANISYEAKGQSMTFDIDDIDDFEKIYMDYMVNKYEKMTVYAVLLDHIAVIERAYETGEFKVDEINKEIDYVKGKMINSAYKELPITKYKSELKKLKKNAEVIDKELIEAVRGIQKVIRDNQYDILKKETIGYYDQKAKASKSPLAIVDKYINTGLFNLSATIDEANAYIVLDKEKFKYDCFQCGKPIKTIDKGLNFLNNTYYDTARKTSHVWNFVSDIEPCPICKLVYMCIPAGIATFRGRGLFINASGNITKLQKVNNSIYHKILRESESDQKVSLSYRHMIYSYLDETVEGSTLALNDVQVIEMKDNQYHYMLLPQRLIKNIYYNRSSLKRLNFKFYKMDDEYYNLYDAVITHLMDNEQLIDLVDLLVHLKINGQNVGNYKLEDMVTLIKLNSQRGGLKNMYVSKQDIDQIVRDGDQLKMAYKIKNANHKIPSLAYKLQGALRANNVNRFMDALLASYSYVGKPVPSLIINCLKDEEAYKTLGYAFTAALVGSKEKFNEEVKEEA